MGKVCSVCGKGIAERSTSGLCRPHFVARFNADPEVKARRTAGVRRFMATPEAKITMRQAARKAQATRSASPGYRERLAERMRNEIQPLSCTPEALALRESAERGRKISETKMAWCPLEYRDMYRRMMRRDPRMRMTEARKLIADQIKADRVRMSPFERQDAYLQAKMASGEEVALASNDMFRRRAA